MVEHMDAHGLPLFQVVLLEPGDKLADILARGVDGERSRSIESVDQYLGC